MALTGAAFAQPDVNNTPKAENPANWQNRGGNNGGRGGRAMTAEERQRMLLQYRVQMIQRSLTVAGITDTEVQTAVSDFAKEQETAQEKLQEKWQQITEALRNNAVTDAQMATLTNDLRAMIEDEKARRKKAEADLDAKISYSKKPKLDAVLMTLGLTGDEADFVNGQSSTTNRLRGFGGPNVFMAQNPMNGQQLGFAVQGAVAMAGMGGFGAAPGGFGPLANNNGGGFGPLANNNNGGFGGRGANNVDRGGNNAGPAGFGGFAGF
jgi:hypothetical protein